MPGLTVGVCWCVQQGDDRAGIVGDVGDIVRQVGIAEEHGSLALRQGGNGGLAKHRLHDARPIEIGRPNRDCLYPTGGMSSLPEPGHFGSSLRLAPIIDRRQILRQRTILRAVEIEVVGKHQSGTMRLAGGENVLHRERPALLPEVGKIGQTQGKYDRLRAGSRRGDGGPVHYVGRHELGAGWEVFRPRALDDANRSADGEKLGDDLQAEGAIADDGRDRRRVDVECGHDALRLV